MIASFVKIHDGTAHQHVYCWGCIICIVFEIMDLGKIDAIGFYSSNVRQYETSTQSFSDQFTSP